MKKKQSGVALVVAMLIVVIASVVATEIFYQQQINIRRTLIQIQAEQLYQVFVSSEEWAKVILQDDIAEGKSLVDHLDEDWAQDLPVFEAEGVLVKGSIADLQACFNLNNLVIKGQANKEQVSIFQNLLTELKLNPDLVWTIVDWIDPDDEPYPNGAEWETYSRLTPAYKAANYRLISVDELYAISGWHKDAVRSIKPYVCTLPPAPAFNEKGRYFPDANVSKLNINTANEVLLRALSKKMESADLSSIIEQQQKKGFESVEDFFKELDTSNPTEPKLSSFLNAEILSVNSDYFSLNFSGQLDNLEQHYQSLIYRKSSTELHTLYRQQQY